MEEALKRYNIPYLLSKGSMGIPALWIDEGYKEILKKSGIRYWTGLEVVILHLSPS